MVEGIKWLSNKVFTNLETGKIVSESGVDVHKVVTVADCVANMDTFVKVVNAVVLIERHEDERSLPKVNE